MQKTLFDMGKPETGGPQLNEAQLRAITHGDGPLLVIAGAGTGKTRVITERIRHLLESDSSLLGENILGLTFTNKAAAEMKARVVKVAGERGKDVLLATFHSFCETILKEDDPNRLALESVDHWILLRRNLARLKLEKFRRLAEPGQFLNDFIAFFSRCQDELVSSDDYQAFADQLVSELKEDRSSLDEDTYKERTEHVALQQEIARAYRASEEILRDKRAIAINGSIAEAVALLKSNPKRLGQLRERYKHILVDEFQDTNIAQLELLHLLSNELRNIVVVGDNDQAIYRFRGASFGSFKLFLERFTKWTEGHDSTPYRVALTHNYRSSPNILRVATQAISMNEVSPEFPKKVLCPNRPEGEKIRIVEIESPESESTWVADELQRLHNAGRRWRDFAVLYRQHSHRNFLVEELSRRKIPFIISKLSILEHPLVRDVLAYLRLIDAPFDDVACARVLAAPAWHLAPEDLVRFAERAGGKRRGKSLYEVLQAPQGELPFDASSEAYKELIEFIAQQRMILRRHTAREILGDLLEWLEVPQRTGTQDRKYVNQLVQFVKNWEPKSDTRGLKEFLEYLDYFEQANGTVSLEDEAPGDAVQLMTVHGAKGLEFPHVFLLRVNSNAFPARDRAPLFEFPVRLMKEELPQGEFHIQEERRLFYVALTRAQERLTLTTVTEKKNKVPVFIEDIVMDPTIKRRDVSVFAPKVKKKETADTTETAVESDLFPVGEVPPKIFSRIARWAATYRPFVPEPLELSSSAIDNFRKCPQQYAFSYLWSLKEGPHASLSFGSTMHITIRRFMEQLAKGTKLSFQEVQRIYETEWIRAGYEDEYQEAEYKKDGLEQLKVFYTCVLAEPPEILELEKAFQLPLANDVILAGRMDQVNSLGRNKVEIVDYKTGKPKKEADVRKGLQLSIYAMAAKEIFEWNPERLVFHYLQDNSTVVSTRDAKQMADAEKIIQETADDIRAKHFPPKPGFACRSCAYALICPAHEESLTGASD
jgi:DNA helicase II / ATP-dependent DNA helicase PcrA